MNHLQLKLIAAAVAVLIVGLAGGYWFAQHRMQSAASEAAATGAPGERRVLYWHDPMVPNTRFDKPGKSPFMDMQLVRGFADEQGGAAVRVSPIVIQNLGVRLGTVEKTKLQAKLAAVGS